MIYDETDAFLAPTNRNSKTSVSEEELIKRAVLRLNGNVLGLVLGFIAALVIFAATNWLVLKGGEVVGPHMQLLGQFFWGYSVTFVGSLVGSAYAFVVGYLCGLFIGVVYNTILYLRNRGTNS